jgi:hypothetical protein
MDLLPDGYVEGFRAAIAGASVTNPRGAFDAASRGYRAIDSEALRRQSLVAEGLRRLPPGQRREVLRQYGYDAEAPSLAKLSPEDFEELVEHLVATKPQFAGDRKMAGDAIRRYARDAEAREDLTGRGPMPGENTGDPSRTHGFSASPRTGDWPGSSGKDQPPDYRYPSSSGGPPAFAGQPQPGGSMIGDPNHKQARDGMSFDELRCYDPGAAFRLAASGAASSAEARFMEKFPGAKRIGHAPGRDSVW